MHSSGSSGKSYAPVTLFGGICFRLGRSLSPAFAATSEFWFEFKRFVGTVAVAAKRAENTRAAPNTGREHVDSGRNNGRPTFQAVDF